MVSLILLKDGSHGKNSNTCMGHPVIRDFSEITNMAKKKGGSNRTLYQMKNFVDTINCCDLKGVCFDGNMHVCSGKITDLLHS